MSIGSTGAIKISATALSKGCAERPKYDLDQSVVGSSGPFISIILSRRSGGAKEPFGFPALVTFGEEDAADSAWTSAAISSPDANTLDEVVNARGVERRTVLMFKMAAGPLLGSPLSNRRVKSPDAMAEMLSVVRQVPNTQRRSVQTPIETTTCSR